MTTPIKAGQEFRDELVAEYDRHEWHAPQEYGVVSLGDVLDSLLAAAAELAWHGIEIHVAETTRESGETFYLTKRPNPDGTFELVTGPVEGRDVGFFLLGAKYAAGVLQPGSYERRKKSRRGRPIPGLTITVQPLIEDGG
ncbi:hypothetical protein AWB91_08930 [Mycobacterium paraense]|uniref:Uncharacterized protein n=1 Tax=Mycobacterium paraense TaxID=767916 RepID=A0ABX3VU97_9MYCO|nr:hypothetical protein [Mycobacterium paraense]ORW33240.1 hypothetical protein AWB91_08930 [Mycobacterium paraense]ORW38427.1 hypothetical protein AWB88_17785 [Mycobacterium paraense]